MQDIESRHGEAGAVDQAADRAVELDVGEVILAGGDFKGVELGIVDHVGIFAMTKDGVVVKSDLGIHRHQPAGLGDDQGIDLDQSAILCQTDAVQVEEEGDAVFADAASETEGQGDLARLKRAETGKGIDGEDMDTLRRLLRHRLDINSPLCRSDNAVAGAFAVESDGEVELFGDLDRFFDKDAADAQPLGAGLIRYQLAAKEFFSEVLRLLGVMHQLDAAGLAAPAGIDLRLDDTAPPHHLRRPLDLIGSETDPTARHRDLVTAEELLGLVFVNIHPLPPLLPACNSVTSHFSRK